MKQWIRSLVALFLLIQVPLLAESPSYTLIEDKAELQISTPGLAGRAMRKLRLQNGLEAVLISDPETNESGAALSVGVGTWDDPIDRPGMAHFVEHLLFLGTEKYPEEGGYSSYLDEHGGKRNAYTMADRTVYMFSVNNDGFQTALDRFGQFFIAPLFTPSGVDRECKAIHQEYCKNLPIDMWRVHYVKKELCNKDHPFHCFCIGNKDTLLNISQDELKEWYKAHYSAHLMRLVVYSSLDLDTLEKEICSLFSAVKRVDHTVVSCKEPIFTASKPQAIAAIVPVQDIQMLELSWELPRFFGKDLEIHADKLVSHILGHEGANSLLAVLKEENLAEGVGVGNFRAGRDQCLLTLSVQLTSKGIKNYEKVIERCFEAIATVKESGIPKFVFDEVKQVEELRYSFQSRGDVFSLVSDYASRLQEEPLETFPRKSLIPSKYAPEHISALLNELTPSNCYFTLVASPSLINSKPDRKEKWLGVEYALLPIAKEKIAAWSSLEASPSLSVPRPNPFMPQNLAIKVAKGALTLLPEPNLLCDTENGCIYTCSDDRFLIPEISWIFRIKTPGILDADPKSHALADLYCHTVKERLNTIAYEATLAGLSYSLKTVHNGLELKITGFSDKGSDFLLAILETMKSAKPTKEEFVLFREQLVRDYQNNLNATPLKQGGELLSTILYKEYAGDHKKNIALKKLSFAETSRFCDKVLKACYVESMLYGNQTREEGEKIWESMQTILNCKPYPKEHHPVIEIAELPSHENASLLAIDSTQPANALILTTDCGFFSFKNAAALEVLAKAFEEPFFSELRTRQQTAYVVGNWSQEIERHLYAFFAIQSSSHDSRDLLARFELFLENILQHAKESYLTKERFESIRASIVYKHKHPAENLAKMGSLLFTLANDYDGDFDWLNKRIDALNELTYDEFLELSNNWFGKNNSKRLAICVNGKLPSKGGISYQHYTTEEKIKKEIKYNDKASISY